MLVAEKVRSTYPNARFWWKDERSHFLGACSQFIEDTGLEQDVLLSGISDSDSRLPWTRQAALYLRDDREVFDSKQARINIVERQDRPEGTFWLKTSKVPFRNQDEMTGGTVGGFEMITAQEAWRYSREKDGE